ncbi:MAG: hypothetical protein VB071_14660 [Lawsonibacter sp.]|nr:hypothetical protein [Lawsonibacter sp.]
MQYIQSLPNQSGAYPAPQSFQFPGSLVLTDEQAAQLVTYNGFVSLTVEGSVVTAVTPDTTNWEAWKASLPAPADPEPTADEITLNLLAEHEERLCMLELAK